MRNMIWYEIVDVRYCLDYISLHIRHQKIIKIYIPIAVIIFSLLAAILGLLNFSWSLIPPILFCFLTFLYELVKLISKDLIVSDDTLKHANNIFIFYNRQFNNLCLLWKEYENEELDEEIARQRYYLLKESEESEMNNINKLTFIFNDKHIRKKAEKLSKDYLNTYLS